MKATLQGTPAIFATVVTTATAATTVARLDPDAYGDALSSNTLKEGWTFEIGQRAGIMGVAFRSVDGAVVSISQWGHGLVSVSGHRTDIPWNVLGLTNNEILALPVVQLEDNDDTRHPWLTHARQAAREAAVIVAERALRSAAVIAENERRSAIGEELLVGDVFVKEEVCGGNDASGGGCGGPLNVGQVPEARFHLLPGEVRNDFYEHNLHEIDDPILIRARDEGTLFVKVFFRPCGACRQRY